MGENVVQHIDASTHQSALLMTYSGATGCAWPHASLQVHHFPKHVLFCTVFAGLQLFENTFFRRAFHKPVLLMTIVTTAKPL